MTREEAIRCLNIYSSTNGSGRCTDKQHYEAKQMAIKALEQEPCENDCISRKDALEAVDKRIEELSKDREFIHKCGHIDVSGVKKWINKIPFVQPKPKIGHWIGDKAYPICPKCNCNIIVEYISYSDYAEMYKPMKYCPNCGCRMIEPQESEDKE